MNKSITESSHDQPLPYSFLSTWSWRISGIITWCLLLESISLNFISYRPICLSPLLIIFPIIHFISQFFQIDKSQVAIFIAYIFLFPLVVFVLSMFMIFNAATSCYRIITKSFDLISYLSSSKGLIIFIIWSLLTILIPIKTSDIYILYIVLFSSIALLPIGLLISARFSLNPLIPADIFILYSHKILAWCLNKYYSYFLKDKLEKQSQEDLHSHENIILKTKNILGNLPVNDFKEFPKKYVVLLYSLCFILLFTLSTTLTGTMIYSANTIATFSNSNLFSITNTVKGLFLTLPLNSTYFDCIFQSFTIISGCQDFTLQSTSRAGQFILISSMFWNSVFFVLIISSFFTVIGLEKDVNTKYSEFKDAAFQVLDNWLDEIRIINANHANKATASSEKQEIIHEISKIT